MVPIFLFIVQFSAEFNGWKRVALFSDGNLLPTVTTFASRFNSFQCNRWPKNYDVLLTEAEQFHFWKGYCSSSRCWSNRESISDTCCVGLSSTQTLCTLSGFERYCGNQPMAYYRRSSWAIKHLTFAVVQLFCESKILMFMQRRAVISRNISFFCFSANNFSSSTRDILFDRLSQLPARSPSLSADAVSVDIAIEDEMVSKHTQFVYVSERSSFSLLK